MFSVNADLDLFVALCAMFVCQCCGMPYVWQIWIIPLPSVGIEWPWQREHIINNNAARCLAAM